MLLIKYVLTIRNVAKNMDNHRSAECAMFLPVGCETLYELIFFI